MYIKKQSDITAGKRSEEVGEGQMFQETEGIMSTEDRKDHIDSHTHTATGILSHCTCLITTRDVVIFSRHIHV